jgi:zinc protease
VLDHIFGSGPGFNDRLSRIVRDEMGLAYSVGGGITDSADLAPGLFRVYVGTMPEEADRVVAAIVEQVRAIHTGAFSDDEVERARQYVGGSWVFDFQTVEQRAERLLELERFGLELDEPIFWPDRVAAVTPRQVRRAARIHIDPTALARAANNGVACGSGQYGAQPSDFACNPAPAYVRCMSGRILVLGVIRPGAGGLEQ